MKQRVTFCLAGMSLVCQAVDTSGSHKAAATKGQAVVT